MVRAPHFHCRGYGYDPSLGNEDPTHPGARKKKNKHPHTGMLLGRVHLESLSVLT